MLVFLARGTAAEGGPLIPTFEVGMVSGLCWSMDAMPVYE